VFQWMSALSLWLDRRVCGIVGHKLRDLDPSDDKILARVEFCKRCGEPVFNRQAKKKEDCR